MSTYRCGPRSFYSKQPTSNRVGLPSTLLYSKRYNFNQTNVIFTLNTNIIFLTNPMCFEIYNWKLIKSHFMSRREVLRGCNHGGLRATRCISLACLHISTIEADITGSQYGGIAKPACSLVLIITHTVSHQYNKRPE